MLHFRIKVAIVKFVCNLFYFLRSKNYLIHQHQNNFQFFSIHNNIIAHKIFSGTKNKLYGKKKLNIKICRWDSFLVCLPFGMREFKCLIESMRIRAIETNKRPSHYWCSNNNNFVAALNRKITDENATNSYDVITSNRQKE